jgi:general secretion pathway protein A
VYEDHYQFCEKPFEITPDPKFLYMTPVCREILSALTYGIYERRGFIAMVGEVGTGKTLILNALTDRLGPDIKVAFISNPDLTFVQLLKVALCDLNVVRTTSRLNKAELIQKLKDFSLREFEREGNVLIIIDEAQALNNRTMENLRMLSNLETQKAKLVQILLSGQQELDKNFSKKEWRQLVQRISIKRYSTEMDYENSVKYIEHRLSVANYKGSSIFTKEALKTIFEYSEGIPRKINILCDNALLIGYGIGKRKIDQEIINEVVGDLSFVKKSGETADKKYKDNVTPIKRIDRQEKKKSRKSLWAALTK